MGTSLRSIHASIHSVTPAHDRIPTGYVIRVESSEEDLKTWSRPSNNLSMDILEERRVKWYTCRRYSQFREFWSELVSVIRGGCACPDRMHFLQGIELEKFPKKHQMKSIVLSQSVINRRTEHLNRLLEKITVRLRTCCSSDLMKCEQQGCKLSTLLRDFFAFPTMTDIRVADRKSLSDGLATSGGKFEAGQSFSDWRGFHRQIHDTCTHTNNNDRHSITRERKSINDTETKPYLYDHEQRESDELDINYVNQFYDIDDAKNQKGVRKSSKVDLRYIRTIVPQVNKDFDSQQQDRMSDVDGTVSSLVELDVVKSALSA